ncbi:Nudix hydrolase 2, partial [Linum grandiflorum]
SQSTLQSFFTPSDTLLLLLGPLSCYHTISEFRCESKFMIFGSSCPMMAPFLRIFTTPHSPLFRSYKAMTSFSSILFSPPTTTPLPSSSSSSAPAFNPSRLSSFNRFLSNSVNPPAAMEKVVAAVTDDQQVQLLTSVDDHHGGVIVEVSEPMDPLLFSSMLRVSIIEWRKLGKKGVWIKLPIQLANLVEVAVKEGFWYHHAEPTYLMLVNWLPGGAHPLPPNASHRVGVGAFVMNDKREVLVVQENSGFFRGTGIWKFPTGVVEEGEDLCTAAVREVKEETAIDAEFVEILAFRQSHKAFFEKSDLFFLCMLRPISFDIQRQEAEIEAAAWMGWDEYVAQPFVQNTGFVKHITDICLAKVDGDYTGFSPLATAEVGGQVSYVYQNAQGLRR